MHRGLSSSVVLLKCTAWSLDFAGTDKAKWRTGEFDFRSHGHASEQHQWHNILGKKNAPLCNNSLIKMWRGNKQDVFPCSASPAQYILRSHSCLWYHSNTLHLCYLVLQSLCGRWCTPTLGISSSRQSCNKIQSLHATHYNMAIASLRTKAVKTTIRSHIYGNEVHISVLCYIMQSDPSSWCIQFCELIKNMRNFQK